MPMITRIGDMFTGYCFICQNIVKGTIITGDSKVLTENQPTSRVGDLGLGFCGHITFVAKGAPRTLVKQSQVARIGDMVSGIILGTILTGCSRTRDDF